MALQIIALLLVLGITFMHSIFGFFSGLINLFCSIISICVAFGFYTPVNELLTKGMGLHPAYSEPICLLVLFLLTLTGLRYAADNLIRGNVHVPMAMDWAGAGICGFINAQLSVGMLVIALVMLPLGGRVLGYSRFERSDTEKHEQVKDMSLFKRQPLWLRSDDMTVGLFNLLSNGALKGGTTFASVYPNFADTAFFGNNTVQPESTPAPYRDKQGDGVKDGISLVGWWEQKTPVESRFRKEIPTEKNRQPAFAQVAFKPVSDLKLIGTEIMLKRASADRAKSAPIHMFRPTQLRLVGSIGGKPADYTPCIIGGADARIEGANRVVEMDNNFRMEGEGKIHAYFEVDREFQPHFVEYRRHARAAVSAEPAKGPPTVALTMENPDEVARRASESGGRTFGSILDSSVTNSYNLPFEMSLDAVRRASSSFTLSGGEVLNCKVEGQKSRYAKQGQEEVVKQFKIPENLRIIQIRYKPKEARTIVGQVFNYVGRVNQFKVTDDRGTDHHLVGYYAETRRGNNDYFELFFNGKPGGTVEETRDPSYRHMLDFKDLKAAEVNDSDSGTIALYFLVPPNVRIMRLSTQTGEGAELGIPSGS